MRRPYRLAPARAAALLISLGASLAPAGLDAEEATTRASPARVRAGTLESWGPEYSLDPQGRPTGFGVELFDAVAEQAGLEVEYRVYSSFSEMTRALLAGEVDVIPNSGITVERREEIAFTRPVETFAIVLFVRREQVGIRRLEDLEGKTVGVVRSNAAVPIVSEREGVRSELYLDPRSALFDLLAGQIDALAYPEPVIAWMARAAGVSRQLRIAGPPLAEIKRAIAVRPEDTGLLARLDAAVEDLVGSALYEEIYRHWYGQPEPFWTAGRVGLLMGGLLLVTFVAMLLWRYRTLVGVNRRLVEAIDERQRAEQELRNSRAKLQAIVDQAQNGIVLADDEGAWVDVNPAICRMLGRSREELLGMHPWDLTPDEEARDGRELWQSFLEAGELRGEFPLVAAGGAVAHVEYAAVANILPGLHLSMLSDVTDRKRAEEERELLERQLAQAQKMEAIGTLAGGIAHDFNNILTAILGYAELARKELPESSEASSHLRTIFEAGQRARDLVRQILSFSRRTESPMEPIRVEPLVEEAVQMLRATLPVSIDLRTDYQATGVVMADPVQIHQILINLCTNAAQAIEPEGDGLVEILLDQVAMDREQVSSAFPGLEPGRYQRLRVRDNGVGMDEETRRRIFEPFFTTKEHTQGTGLGLSVVHGIIVAHGGAVHVDSELGRGSSFEILLPLLEGAPEARTEAEASTLPGGRESVMLVDDEEILIDLEGRALTDLGYEVDAFTSPVEALEALRSNPLGYDLVLTDIVMPEMTGDTLVRQMLEIRPDLPIVLTTGFSERFMDTAEVRRLGARDLLIKPTLMRDLAWTIRRALDEGGRPADG